MVATRLLLAAIATVALSSIAANAAPVTSTSSHGGYTDKARFLDKVKNDFADLKAKTEVIKQKLEELETQNTNVMKLITDLDLEYAAETPNEQKIQHQSTTIENEIRSIRRKKSDLKKDIELRDTKMSELQKKHY